MTALLLVLFLAGACGAPLWRISGPLARLTDELASKLRLDNQLRRQTASSIGVPIDEAALPEWVDALAAAESEPWAQDDVRARARSLYADARDWRRVRDALEPQLRGTPKADEAADLAWRQATPEETRGPSAPDDQNL